MPSAVDAQGWYEFGDLRLERHSQRVFRGDAEILLPPLSRKMLLALVQAAPDVLTHDDLVRDVWQGRHASPETILQRVKLLRGKLGDDAHAPRYIALVRGAGYHLIPPVEIMSRPPGLPVNAASKPPLSRRRWLGVAAGLLAALGALWWLELVPRELGTDGAAAPAAAAQPIPEAAKSLYAQGQLHYHRRGPGDLDLAEARFQEAIVQAPRYAAPWVALAAVVNLRYFDGAPQPYEEAVRQQRDLLQHALELQPGLAIAHARLARLLWVTGAPQEVVEEHFRQALASGADDPTVLAIYAAELQRWGEAQGALQLLQRAVELDPYSVVHRGNLALAYQYIGMLTRAEQELTTLRELHPGTDKALDWAHLRLLQGQPEQALEYLPGIDQFPDRLAIRAMALYQQGEPLKAWAVLDELQAMDHPYAFIRHAEARYLMGAMEPLAIQIATLGERWAAEPGLRAELEVAALELLSSPFPRGADRNATTDDLLALFSPGSGSEH